MVHRLLALLLAATSFDSSASASAFAGAELAAFAKAPVSEDALSQMRGGFALPGGLDVAVTVQSDTRVNGTLLLRSVLLVDKGAPQLRVFGNSNGASGSAPTPGESGITSSFNASGKAATIGGASEGLAELTLTRNGPALAAAGGTVRVEKAGAGAQVILSQPTLEVRHLAGEAYGSAIANRGNDVAIDTVTNINIDLRNATPLTIGSAMFRVEALAVDSATRLTR